MSSAIGHTPITRLELHYLVLREDFSLDVAELKEKWQLRSLLLRVSVAGQGGLEADNFISSIFELSAPRLEELVWEGYMSGKYNIGTSPMLFPKLSKLQLRWIQADDVVWASLIPAKEESRLTHLSIDGCDPDLGSFLARRGHITTLSHLSWTDTRLVSNPDCNAFLSANAQLESCRYEEPSNLNPITTLRRANLGRANNLLFRSSHHPHSTCLHHSLLYGQHRRSRQRPFAELPR